MNREKCFEYLFEVCESSIIERTSNYFLLLNVVFSGSCSMFIKMKSLKQQFLVYIVNILLANNKLRYT